MQLVVPGAKRGIRGKITVPGDKSISHRAVILGALATGETWIENFLPAADCLATVQAFRQMGVEITPLTPHTLAIKGKGLTGLTEPDEILNLGNSGTSARLLLGVLAGQPFHACLTGDASLRRRPMRRVVEPLLRMGAQIDGRERANLLPLAIRGYRPLKGLRWSLPVASAQLKSALLLAGLYAGEEMVIQEPGTSRDHTERMLAYFGVKVTRKEGLLRLAPGQILVGQKVSVPGDISSAAFFVAMGLLLPDSQLEISGVGLNPTRTGFIEVLQQMGATFTVAKRKTEAEEEEPVGNLLVETSQLKAVEVKGEIIPRLIDEIPILAVVALCAEGETIIRDATELRVKESDRIAVLEEELRKMGGQVEALPDGLRVEGGHRLQGALVSSHGDHRIAMSLAVAALLAEGETIIDDVACIDTSFPGFIPLLQTYFPGVKVI